MDIPRDGTSPAVDCAKKSYDESNEGISFPVNFPGDAGALLSDEVL